MFFGIHHYSDASFTIARPSTLNFGLVGHWTFDGTDVTDKVYDKSGQGNHGYFIGGATTTAKVKGKIGQALNFDGVDDYVDMGNTNSLRITGTTISVSAWVRPTTSSVYKGVVAKYGSVGQRSYLLYLTNTYKPSFLIVSGGSVYHNDGAGNTDTVPKNEWSFLTGTFDGRYVRIYRNGVLKHTTDIGTSGNAIDDSTTQPAEMGRYDDSGNYYNNSIDEVRIYNRALSASEVKALYNQSASKFNKTPTNTLTQGLVGHWTFDGADTKWTTNTVVDRSGNGNTGTMTNMSTSTSPAKGKIGQALKFDGVDDNISTNINIGTADKKTFSGWYKFNSLGAGWKVLVLEDNSFDSQKYVGITTGGTGSENRIDLRQSYNEGASAFSTSYTLNPLNLNQWYNIGGVRDKENGFLK